MKNNKLKFSPEMESILEDAKKDAVSRSDGWVYMEHILLAMARKYHEGSESDSGLKRWFSQRPLEWFESKLHELIDQHKSWCKDVPDPKLPVMLDPVTTEYLGDLMTKSSEVTPEMIIEKCADTELHDFIMEVQKDDDKSDDFGKTMEQILEMFKNMASGGTVRLKRLDQDSPKSSYSFDDDEDDDDRSEAQKIADGSQSEENPDSDVPFLSRFGHNMVRDAKEGRFDPMIGRETELQELIEILSCRKKNNAILLGDPGTGKTSIVEGLAMRIANDDVPIGLIGKRLFNLDLNSLVAGTKWRGQYEERLEGIIKDVIKHKDIIIYIDEFHNLIGNGSSSGSGDGANILKPYLARGEFQCIGATTNSEYKKYVEKDGALKRRFQNIQIHQTSPSETVEILKNIKDRYESYHGVQYPDEVLQDCVDLSERFVIDRFFPDKAIDILDMSGSRAKLDSGAGDLSKIKDLEAQISDLQKQKAQAVKNQAFEDAAKIRDTEKVLKAQLDSEKDPKNRHDVVTRDHVARVIEKISGVPSDKIGQSDMGRLRMMKETLEKVVIGQPEAIKDTVMALQRNALGLRDPGKPIASLMMIGPTGSGKTYICKTIASEFFGTPDALIRFDMSEFTEKHEITKLLGSTASYVGYDDEPLFEKIRNRPHSVVLFDEIEKAAPEIYQVFLNILDEGSVTLGNGKKVNFQNCIIIFTGNIGTKELGLGKIGFGGHDLDQSQIEAITKKALKNTFSPEFINRLSKTIVFNKLTDDDLKKICALEIQKLATRMKSQGFDLQVGPEIIDKIVADSDKIYGARDLQRNIVKLIEEPICDALIKEATDGKNISVTAQGITVS
jgi:ATP-dependent Clp protease ATP-binding subunit ClpC